MKGRVTAGSRSHRAIPKGVQPDEILQNFNE